MTTPAEAPPTKLTALDELKPLKQWIAHNKKVPYQATATDATTWMTYDEAQAFATLHHCDGVGFVFAAESPYTGIDLDGCIAADGTLAPAAATMVKFLDSYTEASPSGTGLHIILRGKKNVTACTRGMEKHGFKKVEVYDTARYFTWTGREYAGAPSTIENRQHQLDKFCERVFRPIPQPAPVSAVPVRLSNEEVLAHCRSAKNAEKFTKLYALGDTSGYNSPSEADEALAGLLAFYTEDVNQLKDLMLGSALKREKWTTNREYLTRTCANVMGGEKYAPRLAQKPPTVTADEIVSGCGIEGLTATSLASELERTFRTLKTSLHGVDGLTREGVRGRIEALCKERDLPNTKGLIRSTFTVEKGTEQEKQGHPDTAADPEPWPDEVDGLALLEELRGFLTRFIHVADEGMYYVLSAFVMHTYTMKGLDNSAYILLHSPVPECGKTRVLEILELLAWRPWRTTVPTTATLFRTLNQQHPTLLLDEAEVVRKKSDGADDVRAILHSGNRRGAQVTRLIGDDFESRNFDVFGPKVFALIGTLPPALFSRCITVSMERARKGEAQKLRYRQVRPEADLLRRKCRRWADDNQDTLAITFPVMPEVLSDRKEDTWEPLLAIGQTVVGGWYEKLYNVAAGAAGDPQDVDIKIELVADIQTVFTAATMKSVALVEALNDLEGHPWSGWRDGKGLTTHALARLLKDFQIASAQLPDNTRGYKLADFADVFSRYQSQPAPTTTAAAPATTLIPPPPVVSATPPSKPGIQSS